MLGCADAKACSWTSRRCQAICRSCKGSPSALDLLTCLTAQRTPHLTSTAKWTTPYAPIPNTSVSWRLPSRSLPNLLYEERLLSPGAVAKVAAVLHAMSASSGETGGVGYPRGSECCRFSEDASRDIRSHREWLPGLEAEYFGQRQSEQLNTAAESHSLGEGRDAHVSVAEVNLSQLSDPCTEWSKASSERVLPMAWGVSAASLWLRRR